MVGGAFVFETTRRSKYHTNVHVRFSAKSLDLVELKSALVVRRGLWLWLWIAKSAANRGSKKIFRRFDFGMNFMGGSGNSSSTVLHSCTATLTQRNTATYLLNNWQGWVIVNTGFSAMGVRILRGNS